MAQRVAIALALAGRPRLLVADEPTTALDVTVQAEVLELLRDLQTETEMGVLLITHNLMIVAEACDRAIVMYAGQIVEQGRVQELLSEPLHPYTRGLLASDTAGTEPKQRLEGIPGQVPPPGTWLSGCRFASRCPLATAECRAAAVPIREIRPGRTARCLRAEELLVEVSQHA